MFAFGDKEWPGLAKLNEECGELVQVIGKLMMTHGDPKHWDGSNLRERLIAEAGDVWAALMFIERNLLVGDEPLQVLQRAHTKLVLFEKWHTEQAKAPELEESNVP